MSDLIFESLLSGLTAMAETLEKATVADKPKTQKATPETVVTPDTEFNQLSNELTRVRGERNSLYAGIQFALRHNIADTQSAQDYLTGLLLKSRPLS